jgi:glucokinase
MKDSVIGVDIGGTNIRVGLVNESLEVMRKKTILTDSFGSADELLTGIRQMIGIVNEERRARLIGIALPVPWKYGTEYLVDATNIPYMENLPIRAIQSYFPDYEVYLENDVNVIALLEAEHGASKGCSHSMYITVSTGIGSGIVVHNEIFHGAHGYAGEIGNMFVSDRNHLHSSLYVGTLESLCSGKALDDESKRLYGQDAMTQTLFERYHQHDNQAAEVIELWVEHFSRALASLMQTIDPDMFVLGGAVIDNNKWLIERVKENAKSKVLAKLKTGIRIASPAFGPDAGMIGAAYNAWNKSSKLYGGRQ